jgi:hypothetical protein
VITYASIGVPGDRLVIHDLDHSSTNKIWIDSFDLGMPAVREDMSDRPRSQGADDFTTYYGARAINLGGVLFSKDLEEQATLLDNLKAHFSLFGSAQRELVIQRLGRVYKEFMYVRVADFSAPIETPGNMVAWSSTLVAGDPRMYQRGTPDPHTVSFKSTKNILNNGTGINAPVVIRIVGPAEIGCGVKNTSLVVERDFELARAIKKGSVVEIDTLQRTVTLNGTRNMAMLKPGAWFWKLNPGHNNIHRFGKLDGHIEIDWREARL